MTPIDHDTIIVHCVIFCFTSQHLIFGNSVKLWFQSCYRLTHFKDFFRFASSEFSLETEGLTGAHRWTNLAESLINHNQAKPRGTGWCRLGGSEGREERVGEYAIAEGFAGSIAGDQLISGRGLLLLVFLYWPLTQFNALCLAIDSECDTASLSLPLNGGARNETSSLYTCT